jgi:Ca2+-transporting ATPase
VTVAEDGETVSYLKGAPEVLLARCALPDAERRGWAERAEACAARGLRVLALAWTRGESEERLAWLGLVLFWDPPRAEVPSAVQAARAAGVRVMMVTGDHPATAATVARTIGIDGERIVTGRELDGLSREALRERVAEANVFARVTLEHKLALVEALKERGEIVAMTGDDVNDAPALKRADVGVAMGRRGSDVGREVADLVLLDDNFATIVSAIDEGRNIYENIQKFIHFLFSTNVSLVLLVAIGAVGSAALDLRDAEGLLLVPLTAVQLLWINIISNGPPALAVGLDRTPSVMTRPPRPREAPCSAAARSTSCSSRARRRRPWASACCSRFPGRASRPWPRARRSSSSRRSPSSPTSTLRVSSSWRRSATGC